MADDLKLHKQVADAAQVEALLRNEWLRFAFKEVEAEIIKTWAGTSANETQQRERLHAGLQCLGDVQSILFKVIENGKVAQADINRMAGLNRAA